MLWKSFYKLRIPLLIEVMARLCIRLLQVHFHWCLADSASEVLPKNQPRYMRGVCVHHLNRCKTSDWFSLICRGVVSNDEVTTQRRRFIICCDMTKGRLCHVPAFFGHSKGPS